MSIKLTHEPGYEDWVSMRVISCTVKPVDDLARYYLITLELELPKETLGPGGVGEEGGGCDDNIFAGLTAVTGPGTNTGQTITNGDKVADGDPWNSGANFAAGVLGAGTWIRDFQITLPAPSIVRKVTIDSTLDGIGGLGTSDLLPYYSLLIDGVEYSGSVYATAGDIDVWPWVAFPNDATPWTATWDLGSAVEGTVFTVRSTQTLPGLAYISAYSLFEIAACGGDPDESEDFGAGQTQTVESDTAPTATDDEDSGYIIGQVWVDTATDQPYILVDSTAGAAVWQNIAAPALALDDLTDVNATAPDDGDLLSWDDGSGEWVPLAPVAGVSPATTVESETAWGITPAAGTDAEYARQDHTHGSPTDPVSGTAIAALGFVGELLMQDGVTDPPVPVETEAGDDWLYADL